MVAATNAAKFSAGKWSSKLCCRLSRSKGVRPMVGGTQGRAAAGRIELYPRREHRKAPPPAEGDMSEQDQPIAETETARSIHEVKVALLRYRALADDGAVSGALGLPPFESEQLPRPHLLVRAQAALLGTSSVRERRSSFCLRLTF